MHIADIIGYSVAIVIVLIPVALVAFVLLEDYYLRLIKWQAKRSRKAYALTRVHHIR